MADSYFIDGEGNRINVDLTPVVLYDVDEPAMMISDDGDVTVVDEWATLRCVRCRRTSRMAQPPPDKRPASDGIYDGLCPDCAQGTPFGPALAVLNREERRRAQRKRN